MTSDTMSKDIRHLNIRDLQVECERCGRCLSVCPVYQNMRIETFSPRGRLELIRAVTSNELIPGDRYKESINSCLQCLACFNACPKGVETSSIIRKEKSRMLRDNPGSSHKLEALMLKFSLGKRALLAKIAFCLGFLQILVKGTTRRNSDNQPDSRHLPLFLPEILAGRRIPDINPKTSLAGYPETIHPPARVPCIGEIILFMGCFFGFIDTRPLRAAIRVLGENGFKIHIPKGQACCGAPAALGGHPDLLIQSCTQNLFALKGKAPVITLCATCGNSLQNEYSQIFKHDPVFRELAKDLGERIRDINAFLADFEGFRAGPHPLNKKVALHIPCHLNHGMKVKSQVSTLLTKLPHLEFTQMEGAENCCGGGGLCALKNPALSKKLGDEKARNILDSQADILATPCPGCLIQIKDRLGTNKSQIESVHPIELVARTYGKNDDYCCSFQAIGNHDLSKYKKYIRKPKSNYKTNGYVNEFKK